MQCFTTLVDFLNLKNWIAKSWSQTWVPNCFDHVQLCGFTSHFSPSLESDWHRLVAARQLIVTRVIIGEQGLNANGPDEWGCVANGSWVTRIGLAALSKFGAILWSSRPDLLSWKHGRLKENFTVPVMCDSWLKGGHSCNYIRPIYA